MSIIDQGVSRQLLHRNHWAMVMLIGIYLFSILIHVNIPTTNLGLYNVAIPLFAGGILVIYRDLWQEVWQHHRWTLLLTLGLYVWTWISAGLGGHSAIAIKYTIKYSIYFIVFPALITLTLALRRSQKIVFIHKFLLIFTLLIVGFGVIDYIYPQFRLLTLIRSYENHLSPERLMSVFDNPTKLGAMMAFGLLNAYVMGKIGYLNFYWAQLAMLLCFLMGIGSGSRNFLFTIFLGFLGALYPCKLLSKREAIAIVLIFSSFLVALSIASPTILERLSQTVRELPQNWVTVIQMLRNHQQPLGIDLAPDRLRIWAMAIRFVQQAPMTGGGFEVFKQETMGGNFNAHNLILGILTDLGFPGLMLLMGVIVSAMWSTRLDDPRVVLLCGFIFTAQVLDFFIYDFTTTITMLLMVANAANLRASPIK